MWIEEPFPIGVETPRRGVSTRTSTPFGTTHLGSLYIPSDLLGFVEGRSSYARIGITVHVTAPKIDPGFNAHITLEMANFGKLPVNLRAGIDKPAQLLLAKITTPLEESELYGTNPTDVFQHQIDVIPRSPRKS